MFWLPVIFICFGEGQCGFVNGEGLHTKTQCDKIISETIRIIEKDNKVKAAQGACLKIEAPKV